MWIREGSTPTDETKNLPNSCVAGSRYWDTPSREEMLDMADKESNLTKEALETKN